MSEIERARRTELKRIATRADMPNVQFGRAPNQAPHRRRIEASKRIRIALDRREKIRVANKGHFDRLDVTGGLPRLRQHAQKLRVINYGERWRERADKIFLAERVNGIFHTDSGVGLTETCGGKPNVSDSS